MRFPKGDINKGKIRRVREGRPDNRTEHHIVFSEESYTNFGWGLHRTEGSEDPRTKGVEGESEEGDAQVFEVEEINSNQSRKNFLFMISKW